MEKILIVASSTDTLELKGNKKIPTGYYLGELAIPAQYFIEAGYDVDIATPSGKKPIMDENSKKLVLFDNNELELKAALNFVETYPGMQNPKTLKEVANNSKDYAAVYVPGGHAPMNDLMQDPDLGKLLRDFHQDKKVTAFLCHGPVAALAALPNAQEFRKALVSGNRTHARELANTWQYVGYKMTIFSNAEEKMSERKMQGEVLFYAADALTLAGGYVENAPAYKSRVVQDRELITGQNPASAFELARAVVKAIEERRGGLFTEPNMPKFGMEEYSADL